MTKLYARQGDILIYEVNSFPKEAKTNVVKSLVVAHGENGHLHTVNAQEVVNWKDAVGNIYVQIKEGSLVHEEHNTITLETGKIYMIKQAEREFDYFSKEMRSVTD